VEYLGYLPPKLVPRFLVGADALLLPLGENVRSRFFTCPMKLFEYAASGIPMVVTRQPSTMSLIEDGVQALMVEPNSATDLARAIRRLLEDKPLREHVAGNARKWVAQYSYQQRAVKYREFLDQLLGAGR
jgi:glycosyltransferase involved in cell wall biosynthesis